MRPPFFHRLFKELSFPNVFIGNLVRVFLLTAFLFNSVGPIPAQAQEFTLPKPGVMVHLSPAFNPPILKGIKVHPDNPFRFDFVLSQGDDTPAEASAKAGSSNQEQLKTESTRLIKYFLASLTVPEKDLWVNLSPYEKDRIVPESFGQTEMGRDLLAQDYMLKQITASLIYPEDEIGKKFWKRIYEEAAKKFGTTNIPVNTFNKVWIVPEKAVVYENAKAGTAYVVESKLKVMLEQDYLALEKNVSMSSPNAPVGDLRKDDGSDPRQKHSGVTDVNTLGSKIVREIIIPELTREVNEGKNFAQLRQVYNSLILATWYKKKIKDSILAKVYADKNKIFGLSSPNVLVGDPDKGDVKKIYQQYLKAFKKGVFNYIKDEPSVILSEAKDPDGTTIPRKYFSGGFTAAMMTPTLSFAQATTVPPHLDRATVVTADFAMTNGAVNNGENERKTLDGLTILRFTHNMDLTGGLQVYISTLDEQLLKHNEVTIIQVFYSDAADAVKREIKIGKGRLIQIPVLYKPVAEGREYLIKRRVSGFVKRWNLSDKLRKLLVLKKVKLVLKHVPVVRKYYQPMVPNKALRLLQESFRKILDEYKVNLIVNHSPFLLSEGSFINVEGAANNIPVVLQNHGTNRFLSQVDIPISILARGANYIATVSSLDVPEDMKDRVTVLWDGIDIVFFDSKKVSVEMERELKGRFNIKEGDRVVLFPARVALGKRQDKMLKALSKLKARGIQCKLLFAGKISDKVYFEELLASIRSLGLEQNVYFTDHLSSEELRAMYKISASVVLLSDAEGTGRVLLEAQAMEIPVVASANDGMREALIDGETGYSVAENDMDEVSHKIEALIIDEKKRKAMGEAGRKFVLSKFSLLALTQRHQEFYLRIINEKESGVQLPKTNSRAMNVDEFSYNNTGELNLNLFEMLIHKTAEMLSKALGFSLKAYVKGGSRYLMSERGDMDIALEYDRGAAIKKGVMDHEQMMIQFVDQMDRLLSQVNGYQATVRQPIRSGFTVPIVIPGLVNPLVSLDFVESDLRLDELRNTLKRLKNISGKFMVGMNYLDFIESYIQMEYYIGDTRQWRLARDRFLSIKDDKEAIELASDQNLLKRFADLVSQLNDPKQEEEILRRIQSRLAEPLNNLKIVDNAQGSQEENDPSWGKTDWYGAFKRSGWGGRSNHKLSEIVVEGGFELLRSYHIKLVEGGEGLVVGFGNNYKQLEFIQKRFKLSRVNGVEGVEGPEERVTNARRYFSGKDYFGVHHGDMNDMRQIIKYDGKINVIVGTNLTVDEVELEETFAKEIVRVLAIGGVAIITGRLSRRFSAYLRRYGDLLIDSHIAEVFVKRKDSKKVNKIEDSAQLMNDQSKAMIALPTPSGFLNQIETLKEVLPGTRVIFFDNDHFFTMPVTDMSRERLEAIIKDPKTMPPEYRMSPENKRLLEKFLEKGGVAVFISGGDINNLYARIAQDIPLALRKNLLLAHAEGKQIYGFDGQSELPQVKIDLLQEYYDDKGINKDEVRDGWLPIIDDAKRIFGFDEDIIAEVEVEKVRVDKRYDGLGVEQGHPVQVTFEFDQRRDRLMKKTAEEQQRVYAVINHNISEFNRISPDANVPLLDEKMETPNFIKSLQRYLEYRYGQVRLKAVALFGQQVQDATLAQHLGFLSTDTFGFLNTGVRVITKEQVVEQLINRGVIGDKLGRKPKASEILIGEDSKEIMAQLLRGVRNANSKMLDGEGKAGAILIPKSPIAADAPLMTEFPGQVELGVPFGPEGITTYMIAKSQKIGDSAQLSKRQVLTERRRLAKKYLRKRGLNYGELVPKYPIYFYDPVVEADRDAAEFKQRLVGKLVRLNQILDRDIAIHVMASLALPKLTRRAFHGSAYVVRQGFLSATKEKLSADLRAIGHEAGNISDELAAKLFLEEKFMPEFLNVFHFGYKENNKSSFPVTLFVDYMSDVMAKQLHPDVPKDFMLSTITLDYKKKQEFEDRLLGLIQWPLADIAQEVEINQWKSKPYQILAQVIAEKYVDKLLEIADNARALSTQSKAMATPADIKIIPPAVKREVRLSGQELIPASYNPTLVGEGLGIEGLVFKAFEFYQKGTKDAILLAGDLVLQALNKILAQGPVTNPIAVGQMAELLRAFMPHAYDSSGSLEALVTFLERVGNVSSENYKEFETLLDAVNNMNERTEISLRIIRHQPGYEFFRYAGTLVYYDLSRRYGKKENIFDDRLYQEFHELIINTAGVIFDRCYRRLESRRRHGGYEKTLPTLSSSEAAEWRRVISTIVHHQDDEVLNQHQSWSDLNIISWDIILPLISGKDILMSDIDMKDVLTKAVALIRHVENLDEGVITLDASNMHNSKLRADLRMIHEVVMVLMQNSVQVARERLEDENEARKVKDQPMLTLKDRPIKLVVSLQEEGNGEGLAINLMEYNDNVGGISELKRLEEIRPGSKRQNLAKLNASRRKKDTGFGLAYVWHIINIHGGEFRVDNIDGVPGKGIIASIRLPVRKSSEVAAPAQVSSPQNKAMLSRKGVLENNDSAIKNTGGIDLTSDKAMQVKNDGQGEISAKGGPASGWKFNIDPAMLERLQNAPGFTPVIINVQPLKDLHLFLGINHGGASQVVS